MTTNPMMQLIQMIKSGGNPQQMVINMLSQQMEANPNNPIMKGLYQAVQNKDMGSLEAIARNVVKEQGKDFDKEFNSFRNNLGL